MPNTVFVFVVRDFESEPLGADTDFFAFANITLERKGEAVLVDSFLGNVNKKSLPICNRFDPNAKQQGQASGRNGLRLFLHH